MVPSYPRERLSGRLVLHILAVVLPVIVTAVVPALPAQAQGEAGPVVESDATGLTLTWETPAVRLTRVTVDGVVYSRPDIEGLGRGGAPGAPDLPIYSGLVGLPPTGAATLHIVDVETARVALPYPPLPVARLRPPVHGAPGSAALAALAARLTQHVPDAELYAADDFYPAAFATLGEPAWARDRRVAGLTIHPVRVNPVTREMEVVRRLRVEVRFSAPGRGADLSGQAIGDAYGQALSDSLLNPEAAGWTAAAPRRDLAAAENSAAATSGPVKVVVGQPGLYAISFSALQAAGVPVGSINPATYVLRHGYPRQEVAIRVESDRILFYAMPSFSRYADQDAYFLGWGGPPGQRMATRSGDPTGLPEGIARRTAAAEVNRYYDSLFPGRDGEHWFWEKLQQPDRKTGSFPIQLVRPRADTAATLTVWLQGYTNPPRLPNHRVAFSVNRTAVGELSWSGQEVVTATFSVPGSLLRHGDNSIGLALPGISGLAIEGTWLDAVSLVYATRQITGHVAFDGEAGRKRYSLLLDGTQRVYLPLIARGGVGASPASPAVSNGPEPALAVLDITQPQQPQWVTGFQVTSTTLTIGDADANPARYLVVAAGQTRVPRAIVPAQTVADPPGGADYIIITHPNFSAAIARLANYRGGQGQRVITVNVEAIYDTFGAGRPDPGAIRTFLAHAYATWKPPEPTYVLLVGDGSYDPKDYTGFHAPNFIPPYLADVDPGFRETASDNQLVTFVGGDNVPDMLIGRLSVTSAAETDTVIDKIIAYESQGVPPWFRRQMIVADNPDTAGNFHAEGDAAYHAARTAFWPGRYYFSVGQATQPYMYTDPGVLKNVLVDRINAGAGMVTYFGHSSWLQWAVEDIFHVNDVARLNNAERLPVVVQMTCFTGFFHHPQYPTFDESLVRRAGGGAVAAWGSSGLGSFQGHTTLYDGFYSRVRAGHGGVALGAGALGGKLAVWASGWHLDLLDTFTLFGDPALRVRFNDVPDLRHIYLPVTLRQ